MDEAATPYEFRRLADGLVVLTAPNGTEATAPTMVEALTELLPGAPPELIEHLASRDEGTWACPLPSEGEASTPDG